MDDELVAPAVLVLMQVIAWIAYRLGRLHRDREYAVMLHSVVLNHLNTPEVRTFFAADVMHVAVLAGLESKTKTMFFRRMRSDLGRPLYRAAMLDYIEHMRENPPGPKG